MTSNDITLNLTLLEVEKALAVAKKWGYCSLETAIEHMVQHYEEGDDIRCINGDCQGHDRDHPRKCTVEEHYKRRSS